MSDTDEKKTKTEVIVQKRDEDGRFVERKTYPDDDLKVLGVMAGIAGAFLGFFAWSENRKDKKRAAENRAIIEAQRKRQQETIQWINQQNNSGRNVYELKDGRYLSISNTGEQEFYILD